MPWGQDKGQPEAFAELDTPQIELDETSLAGEYLEKYSQRKKDTGRMYGIRSEKGKYFMGGKRVIIDHDSNLFVDGKRYWGTEGLRKLIVMKEPEIDKTTQKDRDNYLDLLIKQMRSFLLISLEMKRY